MGLNSIRNKIAHALATLALSLATKEYRDMLGATYWYGMSAAARDKAEGVRPPRDWTHYGE